MLFRSYVKAHGVGSHPLFQGLGSHGFDGAAVTVPEVANETASSIDR